MKAPIIPPTITPVRLLCFEIVDTVEGSILEAGEDAEDIDNIFEDDVAF